MGINTGALYIIFIIIVLFGFGYITSGPTPSQTPILTGPEVVLNKSSGGNAKANLQLYNFEGVTITPPVTSLCRKGGANKHPEALVAYLPLQSQGVNSSGQIKLWVSDTKPPYVAPGEIITKASGSVKIPGNRDALAPDGYRWEPQLYIIPQTVDKNGKPYYPDYIQGEYNDTVRVGVSYDSDPLPPGSLPLSRYTLEYVWDVKKIGLTDGEYKIEFVAHDGNQRLGIRCMNIRVYTPPESQNQQNKLPI